jgi:hypothetical protein
LVFFREICYSISFILGPSLTPISGYLTKLRVTFNP